MISLYACSVCLCYVTREGQGYLTDVHFSRIMCWHCRSFGQQGVKQRNLWVSPLFFLNQKRRIRIEEPYATFIYIASLQAYVLHNINNALCLCKQFTTILTPWFWYGKCHFVHCRYPWKARTGAIVLSLFVFTV